MLGEKLERHKSQVFLINTGWSGGAGTGKRIDINHTRSMVTAALNGDLNKVEYKKDKKFHLNIPVSCPNVPTDLLEAKNTWTDKSAYDQAASKLAKAFSDSFDKNYGDKEIKDCIKNQCPSK